MRKRVMRGPFKINVIIDQKKTHIPQSYMYYNIIITLTIDSPLCDNAQTPSLDMLKEDLGCGKVLEALALALPWWW